MGTTQRTKSNGFLALPAAQKSASSTGGGPSGEFGARNSPRAGPNHPRGVRTEYNRRLARRRPPGGAAPPTRVRGEWCWVWCTGARYKPHRWRHTKAGRPTRPSRGRTGFSALPKGFAGIEATPVGKCNYAPTEKNGTSGVLVLTTTRRLLRRTVDTRA